MRPLRVTKFAIAGLYCAYVAFVMLRASGASAWTGNVLPLLLFFCWALSPVVVMAVVRYKSESGVASGSEFARLLLVGAMAVFGAAVYQGGFFGSRPDAQSGLLFVFIPLYQWVAAAVVLLLLV